VHAVTGCANEIVVGVLALLAAVTSYLAGSTSRHHRRVLEKRSQSQENSHRG